MKFYHKKIVLALSLIFIYISGLWSQSQVKQKVKVGFFLDMPYLMSCQDGGVSKTGYAYEYLQFVSHYTNWEYEYVYGTWNTLYPMFENDEIDLLVDISYTEERAKKGFLYPNFSMGEENYRLYTDNTKQVDINIDNLKETLKDKKIGITRNTIHYQLFLDWIKENNYECIPVAYDYDDDRNLDLDAGIIDAALDIDASALPNWEPVITIGKSDYYACISKSRPDLLQQLNNALLLIESINPNFKQELYNKYFSTTSISKRLSSTELKWVQRHPVIRIGCLKDTVYTYINNKGKYKNILPIIFNEICTKLNLNTVRINYIYYDTYDQMRDDLLKGKIDAAFPIYNNPYVGEELGYSGIFQMHSSSVSSIQKENIENTVNPTYAILEDSLVYDYIKYYEPYAQIIVCNNPKQAIALVQSGQAQKFIEIKSKADKYFELSECKNLAIVQQIKPLNESIGVKSDNTALYMILNRAQNLVSEDFINYTLSLNAAIVSEYSLKDFIYKYLVYIILFLLAFFVILVWLILSLLRRKTNARHQLELEKAIVKAEAASKAKSTFIFNISHDIRTPMNAIVGYTELLKRNYGDKEKFDRYLNNIKISSKYLHDLINNVLETARIESGNATLDEEVLSVEGFMDSVLVIFDGEIKKKNLTFTKNFGPHYPYVYADNTKLKQIFLNIISNAVKYTPEGGFIDMQIEETPGSDPNYVIIHTKIKDSGIGMSKDYLPHIFDEFSRERTSTESRIIGTGLGMGITKKIIELMKGTIEIESELGRGTTVYLTIPHRIASECEIEESLRSAENITGDTTLFKNKRILLAEDNDLNAEIATEILQAEGFLIERAKDGIECIDMLCKAETDYFDIILMDIQMPNMDGYSATKHIRLLDEYKKAHIPIIAMTANAFDEDKQNALLAGMNGHVAKPIDIKSFMETLRIVLSNNTPY